MTTTLPATIKPVETALTELCASLDVRQERFVQGLCDEIDAPASDLRRLAATLLLGCYVYRDGDYLFAIVQRVQDAECDLRGETSALHDWPCQNVDMYCETCRGIAEQVLYVAVRDLKTLLGDGAVDLISAAA